MRSISSPNFGETIVDKIKPSEGGLGTGSAIDALVALNAVPAILRDQAGGVAGLDADMKISTAVLPLDNVSVDGVEGPISVVKGSANTYVINNYDAFTTYALTAIGGSVSRSEELISYIAPTALGASGFVLNGRAISILVVENNVVTPVIAVTDTPGIPVTLNLTGSAFAMRGVADTHLNTDWQIATDVGFTNIVTSSMADAVNKTSYLNTGMAINSNYFIRARYRSVGGYMSAWSNIVLIVTKSTYVLSIEEAKIVATDRAPNDQLGYSNCISADGTRLVVGCYYSDSDGVTDSGAAYVFVRNGNSWIQEAKLIANDKAANDQGGHYVSISADGSRVAMGAPLHSAGAASTGAVYIFKRSGTNWDQEAKLVASDRLTLDYFGHRCSMSADGSRVLIGAYGVDSGANGTGAAYVFYRSNTSWVQEAKLVADDKVALDYFGIALALSSDATRAVIGAYNADSTFTDTGSAYVFLRSGTNWTQEAKLVALDKAASDRFGNNVAITANGNRVVVGSFNADAGATDAGAAYVFSRNLTSWTQEAKLIASDGAINDTFGCGVAINSDGIRIAIGSNIAAGGAVYMFARTGTSWAQENKFSASDKTPADTFGISVSFTADATRLVVGANLADPGVMANAGAAYVYRA